MIPSSFNIILFGETGVGKSSIINLIAGRKVAQTSPDGEGCTLESNQYTFPLQGRTFHIWDTVGLGEPFLSKTHYLSAIEKAYTLIRQVTARGGLDLLLFCIPGDSPITQTMISNYRLFSEVLCEKRISIAAVVTRLEDEEEMEEWWGRNEKRIAECSLKFSGHACVTGLPGHPKTAESRYSLEQLLLGHDSRGRNIAPTPSRRVLQSKSVTRTQHGDTAMRSFNVILFGEAGVGKSSVINLMAKRDVANTSPDAWGCTLESKQYTLGMAGRTFNIWDTIGLGEPEFSKSNYLGAIQKTYALITQLKARGGLDLLLFCMPGSRVTTTMEYNYKLFFEVLCKAKIPIAAVVTRLEGEEKMDNWWDRNEKYVSESGLRFGGHACVTAQREHAKAAEGRSALELLLLGYDHEGRYPMPPASDWFSGFLERLPRIPRAKELKVKPKEMEQMLRKRCNMDRADAQRLAEVLCSPSKGD